MFKKLYFTSIVLTVILALLLNSKNFIFREITYRVENSEESIAIQFAIILFFILLLTLILDAFKRLFNDKYLINIISLVKLDVMKHLHELDFYYHTKKNSGSLISAFKRGEGAIFSLDHDINDTLIVLFINFVVISVTFSYLSPVLFIFIIIPVALNLVIGWILLKRNLAARNIVNKQDDITTGIIVDNMISFSNVKYFAKEEYEIGRLQKALQNWKKASWSYFMTFRFIDFNTGLVSSIGIVGSILYSVIAYANSDFSLADVVLVTTFVITFFPTIDHLIYNLRDISKRLVDLEKYLLILDEEVEIKDVSKTQVDLSNKLPEFSIDNVSFHYPGRSNVLNNINLNIEAGKSYAFVGESGAGKSTLVKLILRFYDVSSGSINLAGTNIKDISKQDLRNLIGVVPQDAIMFNESIKYNIGYGDPSASFEQIRHAAKIAKLDEFIETLPKKYDTIVGERGIKLSGGQRQRLAIARVFLADRPIIIFDEATSQLDSESEQIIQEAFWKIAQDKTVIIIAHRLSTILKADQIIVFNEGRIIEKGTHFDLLNSDGYYAKLWNIQKGGMIGSDSTL